MILRYSYILIFFFFSALPSLSKADNLDSLQKIVHGSSTKEEKITALKSICNHVRQLHLDTFFIYVRALEEYSKGNQVDALLSAYHRCIYYYRKGKLDSFIHHYLLQEKQVKKYPNLQVRFINAYGSYFIKKHKHKEAFEQFYQAMKMAETLKDTSQIIVSKAGIGWNHMEMNQFEKAIQWFKTTLPYTNHTSYQYHFAPIYTNIASCYGGIGQFDSSRNYCNLEIKQSEQNKDELSLANAFYIAGNLADQDKNHQEAEKYFMKGYAIHLHRGDPFYIVSDMSNIAVYYANTNQFQKGITMAEQAILYAEKNKLDAKINMAYEALFANYKLSGNYKMSAITLEKMLAIKDSIYARTSAQEIAEMNALYETEKKEHIIAKQRFELTSKNYLLLGGVLFILLAGLLFSFIFRNAKNKHTQQLQEERMVQQDKAAMAVLEAEEQERRRIAADLHDGVGQMLTAIKLNLDAVEDKVFPNQPEEKKTMETLRILVDESCKEVRNVSHSIMPNALIKSGLGNAVKDFIEKVPSDKISIQLHHAGIQENLPSNIEIVVYRVIQECVQNVIKHAEATQLDIAILREADGLHVTIEDNGKGFHVSSLEKADGIGMKNIKSRIDFLKGQLDIDSKPGNGTLIAFYIPIAEKITVL
mgnify:CR=1 FL=1